MIGIGRLYYRLKRRAKELLRARLSSHSVEAGKTLLFWILYLPHFASLALKLKSLRSRKFKPAVLLCIANPGSIGGNELVVQMTAKFIQQRKGPCLILISGIIEEGGSNVFIKNLNSLGIPWLYIGNIGLADYHRFPSLKRIVAEIFRPLLHPSKHTICHMFNPLATKFAPIAKQLALRTYYTEASTPTEGEWWKPLKSTMSQIDYVTAVSTSGLLALKKLYGYQGPSQIIRPMYSSPSDTLRARKPQTQVFHIVYFGRLSLIKGVDQLIAAFSLLMREIPYATLSIIGSGEQWSLLKELVNRLDLNKSVEFTDWLERDQLFLKIADADLFCLPSEIEGLPCSIQEAMSIGLPVLATDVGGVSEIIKHKISGFLIPPKDQKSLYHALLQLAKDPELRQRLGDCAYTAHTQREGSETHLSNLLTAYNAS